MVLLTHPPLAHDQVRNLFLAWIEATDGTIPAPTDAPGAFRVHLCEEMREMLQVGIAIVAGVEFSHALNSHGSVFVSSLILGLSSN